MKKTIVLGLSIAALACASQAPALTVNFSGFLRTEGVTTNLLEGKDQDPDQYITQRFRLKADFVVNDYVKVVWFNEIDMEWGDSSYTNGRNQGGAVGGDTVNLETKNLYMEVKAPGMPLTAAIGLQGFNDIYDSTFWGNDAAGVKLTIPTGKLTTELAWYKWWEGNRSTTGNTCINGDNGASDTPGCSRNEDDADWYYARLMATPIAGLNITGDVSYYKNQGSFAAPFIVTPKWTSEYTGLASNQSLTWNRSDLYYLGLNASYQTPIFGVKGWFQYNWGKIKETLKTTSGSTVTKSDADTKVAGYAGTLRADVNVPAAGLNFFARGIYYSKAGDDPEKIKSVFNPAGYSGDYAPFVADNALMIMLFDTGMLNYGAGYVFAAMEPANAGYGMTGAVLSANLTLPSDKNFYVRTAAGYFKTLSDEGFYGEREGKTIGAEVAARVGYKFFNGAFDLSVAGAYAWLGDYWDHTVSPESAGAAQGLAYSNRARGGHNSQNPDNLYKLYVSAMVPF